MLPSELLRRIRRIEIRTNRLVNETLAGSYHSVFKGLGMEFSEVREYTPGDDIRTIDWNVTSRMGHPFVKKFVEERELTVVLLVDASGSGVFGSETRLKREIATEIAALIAFSAIKNNDRVGLLVFTDRIEKFVPPRKGRSHVLRLIREVLAFEPQSKGTDITQALETLGKVVRKKAVVFLISDFMADGYARALKIANRRHDLIAVSIADRREEELPAMGLVVLEDAETGERILVDTSNPAVRRDFAAAAAEREDRRQRYLRTAQVDAVAVRTADNEPYDRPLMRFFAQRALKVKR